MKHTKSCLLITLFAAMRNGEVHYTKASVDALRGLLKRFHGISVGRRRLFDCLRDFQEKGVIRRQERYRHDENGEIRQISSMISFTIKGIKVLVQRQVRGAKKLYDTMISWWKKKDGRFPQPGPEVEKFTPLEIKENERRLKELVLSF